MSKQLKVGDKIVVIAEHLGDLACRDCSEGTVYTVSKAEYPWDIDGQDYITFTDDVGDEVCTYATNVKLAKPKKPKIKVGDTVKVLGTKHTGKRVHVNGTMMQWVGTQHEVTAKDVREDDPTRKYLYQLDNKWWYAKKDLELVTEETTEEPSAELSTEVQEFQSEPVTCDTPIGTKVRVVEGNGFASTGSVGTLKRHDGDYSPAVQFSNDYWFVQYNRLETVHTDTPITKDNGDVSTSE